MERTMKYASLDLGTIEAVFNKLGGIDGAQRFLRGDAEVVINTHRIDCSATPFIPEGWSIHEEDQIKSAVCDTLEWNPDLIDLHLTEEQRTGSIVGTKLKKKFEGQPVLTANVLDYLLEHPELIPEDWKGKYVYFWGTIYRRSDGGLSVRCLCWDVGRWDWRCLWPGHDWHDDNPAALVRK